MTGHFFDKMRIEKRLWRRSALLSNKLYTLLNLWMHRDILTLLQSHRILCARSLLWRHNTTREPRKTDSWAFQTYTFDNERSNWSQSPFFHTEFTTVSRAVQLWTVKCMQYTMEAWGQLQVKHVSCVIFDNAIIQINIHQMPADPHITPFFSLFPVLSLNLKYPFMFIYTAIEQENDRKEQKISDIS